MDQQPPASDRKQLIAKVAARHGIRIDEEDPAFYVLSLNEFALDEATKTIVERIQRAGQDFETAFERVQQRAGQLFAQQVKGVETVRAVPKACRSRMEAHAGRTHSGEAFERTKTAAKTRFI